MTPEDLAAIRARDAVSAWGPEDALPACLDRRALLAEVDRLSRYAESWVSVGVDAERARIRAAVEGLLAFVVTVERPMDALEGPIPTGRYPMPPGEVVLTAAPGRDGLVDRAAVLAAIDGGDA